MKKNIALMVLAILAVASNANAAVSLPEGLTGGFTEMGTAVVAGVAVFAAAAFGLKVVPMAARFFTKVWRAIIG